MSIASDLLRIYNEAAAISNSTMSYMSGSTAVTASCFKSYSDGIRYEYDGYGSKKQFSELSIICKRTDVDVNAIQPLHTKIFLDGKSYYVGNIVTNNPVTTWITLRNDI